MKEFAKRWGGVIEMFLASVDREHGSILHLPYPGGVLQQPRRTLQVWRFLQSVYTEAIRNHLERLKKKGK